VVTSSIELNEHNKDNAFNDGGEAIYQQYERKIVTCIGNPARQMDRFFIITIIIILFAKVKERSQVK